MSETVDGIRKSARIDFALSGTTDESHLTGQAGGWTEEMLAAVRPSADHEHRWREKNGWRTCEVCNYNEPLIARAPEPMAKTSETDRVIDARIDFRLEDLCFRVKDGRLELVLHRGGAPEIIIDKVSCSRIIEAAEVG